jgi:hypothetical protein
MTTVAQRLTHEDVATREGVHTRLMAIFDEADKHMCPIVTVRAYAYTPNPHVHTGISFTGIRIDGIR